MKTTSPSSPWVIPSHMAPLARAAKDEHSAAPCRLGSWRAPGAGLTLFVAAATAALRGCSRRTRYRRRRAQMEAGRWACRGVADLHLVARHLDEARLAAERRVPGLGLDAHVARRRSGAATTSRCRGSECSRISCRRARSAGSSIGTMTSTRRWKLRGIQSALERYTSSLPPFAKQKTRPCSRKRSMSARTSIVSRHLGTPGRRQQMPRTSSVIVHPRLRRAVERLDDVGVDERVHLRDDLRRPPRARVLRLARDEPEDRLVQPERRDDERVPLRRRAVAGEQVEERRGVLADRRARAVRSEMSV